MKAWLKGGLIFVGIIFILSLVLWGALALSGASVVANPLIFFLLPGSIALFGFRDSPSILILILGFIISILLYFIIGTIIGLIIKKIRSKKRN